MCTSSLLSLVEGETANLLYLSSTIYSTRNLSLLFVVTGNCVELIKLDNHIPKISINQHKKTPAIHFSKCLLTAGFFIQLNLTLPVSMSNVYHTATMKQLKHLMVIHFIEDEEPLDTKFSLLRITKKEHNRADDTSKPYHVNVYSLV